MPVFDQYVQVTCLRCRHSVQMNPKRVPAMSHKRLVCTKCGARGGDINLVTYPVDPKVKRENVLYMDERLATR